MLDTAFNVFSNNNLITAFIVVGIVMYVSYIISDKLTIGRIHGSAIAIVIGLVLAYIGGAVTDGTSGIADLSMFSGIGLMGGAMLRDFAIISTAYGARLEEIKNTGLIGVLSLFLGVLASFVAGVVIALLFGYTDAVALTTIGAGAVTYLVGPVTGTAIGASSEVLALSVAAGLTKSVVTMIATPILAKYIGLNNPRTAMIFGGMIGTTSGVSAGLAATDPKLVPYGAMTATFYTGLGTLLCPSILFIMMKFFFG